MTHYRIIREDFYDERGNSLKTLFLIEKQKRFLFIKWWTYVTHNNIGIKSIKNVPLFFNGVYEAEQFMNTVLLNNKKYCGNHKIVMREYNGRNGK